ncbi:MAG: bifunctional YncE family protein/alkaline phosphatase family protein [Bryobacteraceae bacterium]
MSGTRRLLMALVVFGSAISAQSYTAPAGDRPALRRSGPSILPGGRIIAPLGEEYVTGPGPFGIAVSASGRTVVTANGGPFRYSYTVLEQVSREGGWHVEQAVAPPLDNPAQADLADWHSVSLGVALSGERGIYLAEGENGRVSLFDSTDERRRAFDLNQGGFTDSFTGDLALDAARGILYVADQANFRIAAIDVRLHKIVGSVRVGRLPLFMALAPDGRKLYVTNCGMFEYRALAGAPEAGLAFPAFGFPSAEAVRGVRQGGISVPGLGDANAREADSVAVLDVTKPAALKVEAFVRTGLDFGGAVRGGSGPAGILAAAGHVFVANANDDSVTVLDAATNRVEAEIPIRIPGLEGLRGVIPTGLAYHEASGWLLVAEAGINAVGVIDVSERRVIGHLPVAWFPTRVALDGDTVLVANARGHGVGPNAPGALVGGFLPAWLYQGTITVFHLPSREQLKADTEAVLELNGFRPRPVAAPAAPPVRHVVLIVKESLSYDEVLGDIASARNGPVMGDPRLARLGTHGLADGRRQRLSIKDVNLTPNQHALARRWASSDNFYADGEASVEGHHWLAGVYPNPWMASSVAAGYGGRKSFRLGPAPGRLSFAGMAASVEPEDLGEAGTLWDHLAAHGVSFLNFGEGFELAGAREGTGLGPAGVRLSTNMPMPEALFRNTARQYPGFNLAISDQQRATRFIEEIDRRYRNTGAALPALLFVDLPGDYLAEARPEDGYPYQESRVSDNDYALGRIVEYLSGTPWWRDMAILVTEADTHGGVDHVDAHRTVLLCAGPWAKAGYVSHRNVSFPGLLKTIFRLLQLPALDLFDATAADLTDCFAKSPDTSRYYAVPVDRRIFDPRQAADGAGKGKPLRAE